VTFTAVDVGRDRVADNRPPCPAISRVEAETRALDRGETFVVTRNGVPVGELHPVRARQFVPADAALAAFAGAPTIEVTRFREDVDALLDQDPTPHD